MSNVVDNVGWIHSFLSFKGNNIHDPMKAKSCWYDDWRSRRLVEYVLIGAVLHALMMFLTLLLLPITLVAGADGI